jgi:hypothetical protein
MMNKIFRDASRFPLPASRFPLPASRFPLPASRFPLPASRFPLLLTVFWCMCWHVLSAQDGGGDTSCRTPGTALPTTCSSSPIPSLCEMYPDFEPSEGYSFKDGAVNGGFTTGQVISNRYILVGGTYEITTSVDFTNCVFAILPGGRILISPSASAVNRFQQCKFFGLDCGYMWKGIECRPQAGNYQLLFYQCKLEDAYIGLSLREGIDYTYTINDTGFTNNYIGISNETQNNTPLKAFINECGFLTTRSLLTPGAGLPNMPYWPFAWCGIEVTNTSFIPSGGLSQANNSFNRFSCMINGIISNNSNMFALYCTFANMDIQNGRGIWSTGGQLTAAYCTFTDQGHTGVLAEGSNLTATRNSFVGQWKKGILSQLNSLGQLVNINNNTFNLPIASSWDNCIELHRSKVKFVNTPAHNIINANVIQAVGVGSSFDGIRVFDNLEIAKDECRIYDNEISVTGGGGSNGIYVQCANGDNFRIYDNDAITFTGTFTGIVWGIAMIQPGVASGKNHSINRNRVVGAYVGTDPNTTCAIHISGFDDNLISVCENIVDNSEHGFHFVSRNDACELRENHMNHHTFGILVGPTSTSASSGVQYGRGNTWLPDPDACTDKAAKCDMGADPILSRFIIREPNTSTYTYLPNANKLDPAPSSQNWFFFDANIPADYCDEDPLPQADEGLTNGQNMLIAGTLTGLSEVDYWLAERGLYLKLMGHPELRPTGSAASSWFSSKMNSSVATYAQFDAAVMEVADLGSTESPLLYTNRTQVSSMLEYAASLSPNFNLANWPTSASPTRDSLLTSISATNSSIVGIQTNAQLTRTQSLTNLAAQQTNLPANATWEMHQKQINAVLVARLQGITPDAALYTQLLQIADQQGGGDMALAAFGLLSPCDQALRMHYLEGLEVEGRHQTVTQPATARLVDTNLQISPNPNTGEFTVNIRGQEGKSYTLLVYNAQGKVMQDAMPVSSNTTISINLRPVGGLYVLALYDMEGQAVAFSRFIIH